MLTGKQRSYLKSLANGLETAVYIGKNDLTEATLAEMDDYLAAHELVKVKVQESCGLDVKELANEAAGKLNAEFVQAIGRRFVLYKENKDKKTIELPR
ncbi:MAG: ribosome assembly RNA-binding protein YhbY [Firmicutes bacterium]|nr:ribosome assembly RNA-binding protein YhbY [Bacillota bacterium]